MHPDLSAHLHSNECNAIIAELQKCHQEHPYKKFVGACNELDRKVWNCLKKERQARQKANLAKARRGKDTGENEGAAR